MNDSTRIWHLSRHAVNQTAWDNCLQQHFPGLLYMQSWYLESMVPEWEALVKGKSVDGPYDAVMALPAKKKWGLSYLYQPFLTAQLGYVGQDYTEKSLLHFLQAIPVKFRYWDLCFNEKNPPQVQGYSFFSRKNFVLSVEDSFEIIQRSFSENTIRNMRKAEKQGCIVDNKLSPAIAFDFFIKHQRIEAGKDDMNRLKQLVELAEKRNQISTYGIKTKEGDLLSSCIFFRQDHRFYYLLPANNEDSRKFGASHALVSAFVKDYAGQNLLLDFEGSDIESVAQFYKSFGAVESNYPAIRMNKLPFYLRWMK